MQPFCQPLLEFIELEQWLTKWLQRQPSRAILIATTMISHGGLTMLESRGLKRPAATSYGHRDGRQSGRRDGVSHCRAFPAGRRAIAAPNRRPWPRGATGSCPCMSSVRSVRGIRRRCMGGGRSHCRRRPGLPSSSSLYFGFIPRVEYVGINTDKRYAQLDFPNSDQEVDPKVTVFLETSNPHSSAILWS